MKTLILFSIHLTAAVDVNVLSNAISDHLNILVKADEDFWSSRAKKDIQHTDYER